jgi:hypothetical protein
MNFPLSFAVQNPKNLLFLRIEMRFWGATQNWGLTEEQYKKFAKKYI